MGWETLAGLSSVVLLLCFLNKRYRGKVYRGALRGCRTQIALKKNIAEKNIAGGGSGAPALFSLEISDMWNRRASKSSLAIWYEPLLFSIGMFTTWKWPFFFLEKETVTFMLWTFQWKTLGFRAKLPSQNSMHDEIPIADIKKTLGFPRNDGKNPKIIFKF